MRHRIRHCRGCSEPIIWTETEKGRRMPVNAKPDPEGTFVLLKPSRYYGLPVDDDSTPIAVHVKSAGALLSEEELAAAERFVPHHSTCTEVQRFR